MKLFIGFITYNKASSKYLAYFLPSLKEALNFLPENEYIVAAFDNSDSDKNENRLALEFFDYKNNFKIKYHSQDRNIGFGAAYNKLIDSAKKSEAKYFFIINPDLILDSKSILNLIKKLDADESVGAVSPKIKRWDFKNLKKTQEIDSCGLIMRPGLKFIDLGQGEIDRGQYDTSNIVAPSGAAGMFRVSTLDKIKEEGEYFDSRFFMYKEDCDLAYRLKKNNIKSFLVSNSLLYHDRTASAKRGLLFYLINRRKIDKKIRTWSFVNQHLIFAKYFKQENFFNKLMIIKRVILIFIFSLMLEQFNLKHYKTIFSKIRS